MIVKMGKRVGDNRRLWAKHETMLREGVWERVVRGKVSEKEEKSRG